MRQREIPDRHPSLAGVRAIITTKWDRGYRPLVIRTVESYFVDSSLDNDADTWQIQIGDPSGDYLALLRRDSEVKVEIIGVGKGAYGHICTGFADEITYDNNGLITIEGRDMSALALDSAVPPHKWGHVYAWAVIGMQAHQLGFQNTSIAKTWTSGGGGEGKMWKKQIKTDGSETYWEFWYRLIRHEKMWLWCGPTGALIGNTLNYTQDPTYFFGTPRVTDPDIIKRRHMPVEVVEVRKSTQGRLGEVMIKGHAGKSMWTSIVRDPMIKDWTKRPRKIMLDKEAHSMTGTNKMGWLEIFEGKVGSIEVKLTVSDPGFFIRPNHIARLRIPEIRYGGEFFVVGTKTSASSDGVLQEIRLREKLMALSRRVPLDPKIQRSSKAPKLGGKGDRNIRAHPDQIVPGEEDYPESWHSWFYDAARAWYQTPGRSGSGKNGKWDFALFWATLLGISWHESHFHNVRNKNKRWPGISGAEWQNPPSVFPGRNRSPAPDDPVLEPPDGPFDVFNTSIHKMPHATWQNDLEKFKQTFANEPGEYVPEQVAVGPMQLLSLGLKQEADDKYMKGFRNQFAGGRWHPKWNIWVGARYFKECLDELVGEPTNQVEEIFNGYVGYHFGIGGARSIGVDWRNDAAARDVRKAVLNDPGFFQAVKDYIRKQSHTPVDNTTDVPTTDEGLTDTGDFHLPTESEILRAFSTTEGSDVPNPQGAPPAGTGPIKQIPSPNFTSGRSGNIEWVVIHTMEWPEEDNTAENCANMFANPKSGVSAHYNIDANSIVQSVQESDTAYAAYPTGNAHGIHLEHAGYASQSPAEWQDDYSQNMLKRSAALTALICKRHNIPITKLDATQVAAHEKGICGHLEITNAFHESDHTDPGPNFPWDQYLDMIRRES